MKRTFLSLVLISMIGYIYANLTGDGYYRVKNYGTQRWASLIDDMGSIDKTGEMADLHALGLNKNTENILSNPASIVYVKLINSYNYDVSTQGTSLSTLVNIPLHIMRNKTVDGEDVYKIYGVYNNITEYIYDGQSTKSFDKGAAALWNNKTNSPLPDASDWYFTPVDETTDNFIGVKPSVNINGVNYATFYASFPFTTFSSEMEVYYIGRITNGYAELIELTDMVPASTPVLIKCAGTTAYDNKLKIGTPVDKIKGNSLTGVYFNYTSENRVNHIIYKPETMRILGRCSDGSLGFITADLDYIPANTAYLKVPANSPSELKCLMTDEFEAAISSGINEIVNANSAMTIHKNVIYSDNEIIVMNVAGQTVLKSNSGTADVSSLPKGVYVARSGNNSLKFIR